ncbi:unnamed protein product [Cunninghamella blakesleeana]
MQYVPNYYGYPNGNQEQSQQQQQPMPNQPSLHIPHPSPYTQSPQHPGIPTYSMTLPNHQPHPSTLMGQPANEFNMLTKPKRKQVKNACVNCQKACKKCDDGRPCQRCIKYGLTETCRDSVRKERKKGVKRGPYKRRNQANADSPNSSSGGSILGQTNNNNATNNNNNNNSNNNNPLTHPYPTYPSYENYPSTNPNVAYPNAMQQYVLAMQQQQALYQNLPYQQAIGSGASTPNLPLTHSPSANTNTNDANSNSNNNSINDHHSPSSIHHDQKENNTLQQPTSNENVKADDEEGSKLNILSQLCSDVLDSTPEQKSAMIHNNNNNNNNNETNNNIQRPILSTPISSTPSSTNASPTLYKQDVNQMVYPNQPHQQQQHNLGQNNWQPHW